MVVRLHSTLRGRAGLRLIEIEAQPNVRAALDAVTSRIPVLAPLILDSSGELTTSVVIFRNGRHIDFLEGADTPLAPTDTLDLFPRSHLQRAFVVP